MIIIEFNFLAFIDFKLYLRTCKVLYYELYRLNKFLKSQVQHSWRLDDSEKLHLELPYLPLYCRNDSVCKS